MKEFGRPERPRITSSIDNEKYKEDREKTIEEIRKLWKKSIRTIDEVSRNIENAGIPDEKIDEIEGKIAHIMFAWRNTLAREIGLTIEEILTDPKEDKGEEIEDDYDSESEKNLG